MRRFLAGVICGAGALFAFRRLLRRRRALEPSAPDPANELKRKLEASRAAEAPSPEPEPAGPGAGVDERRREVHERGRAAVDRMRDRGRSDAGSSG